MAFPPGVLEGALVLVLGGAGALIARSVRRRKAFLKAAPEVDLPALTTDTRLTLTLRRLWQDAVQGVPLVEASLGGRRFVFCPTDHDQSGARYAEGIGKPAEVALFGLATLAAGGVDAMRAQIKDADQKNLPSDFVTLHHEGQFANDYVVIGRVLSRRDEAWGEMALAVYRVQVIRASDCTLVLELAIPSEGPAFGAEDLVHGSARLFGYLP